jgi:hypothetical protein
MFLFLVTAHHATGHGDTATTYLVTKHFEEAVKAVDEARDLGFDFCSTDHGISIDHMEVEICYSKARFKSQDGRQVPVDFPLVLFFRHSKDGFRMEYYQSLLERLNLYLPKKWLSEAMRIPE